MTSWGNDFLSKWAKTLLGKRLASKYIRETNEVCFDKISTYNGTMSFCLLYELIDFCFNDSTTVECSAHARVSNKANKDRVVDVLVTFRVALSKPIELV